MQSIMKLPPKIRLMEVGPRDGLQNEASIVDTISKINFIENLVEAGLKRIEITAFVSPLWIPPLADQYEVALGIKRVPGVSYAALVPNVKGYERAVAAGVNEVSVVVAASNTHNLKNLNGDTKKVMERYHEVAKRARQDKVPFRAYISCGFGCSYEGEVAVSAVLNLASKLLEFGAYEIALSDTIGVASPLDTMKVLEAALLEIAQDKIALHMHDTRGLALANIFAALTLGIGSFDASAGGLGGCPYAPGASGNVATEDLVYMLEAMGLDTGVSLEKLCDTSLQMEKILGRKLPAKLIAGRRTVRT
ncbi:MAG TPA: hydroxymethylglutaryl-CoA lyase [Myxococcota bacterium]|nr:hydroxymethylglutaryl-CoA lyase [Myxococcota bacterium]